MNLKRAIVLLMILAFLPMAVMAQNSTRATIRVTKNFSQGNPDALAHVYLDCNTSIIPDDDEYFSDGESNVYVLKGFDNDGQLDCTITEDYVLGYWGRYACGDDGTVGGGGGDRGDNAGQCETDDDEFNEDYERTSAGYCEFTGIEDGDDWECVIRNRLMAVEIDVKKIWIDEHPEFNNSTYARAEMNCNRTAPNCFEWFEDRKSGVKFEDATHKSKDYDLVWKKSGDIDTYVLCPSYRGTTCTLDEQIRDSSVESEDDCDFTGERTIFPGGHTSCTLTNTRIYEGIPTLSQYGQGVLALLMLGVGLIGFRRFA